MEYHASSFCRKIFPAGFRFTGTRCIVSNTLIASSSPPQWAKNCIYKKYRWTDYACQQRNPCPSVLAYNPNNVCNTSFPSFPGHPARLRDFSGVRTNDQSMFVLYHNILDLSISKLQYLVSFLRHLTEYRIAIESWDDMPTCTDHSKAERKSSTMFCKAFFCFAVNTEIRSDPTRAESAESSPLSR